MPPLHAAGVQLSHHTAPMMLRGGRGITTRVQVCWVEALEGVGGELCKVLQVT